MIYGELEDEGDNFFIQRKMTRKSGKNLSGQLELYSPTTLHETYDTFMDETSDLGMGSCNDILTARREEAFDWNNSFILRLEYVPETHVSPRIASKIMFAGKAVQLLLQAMSQAGVNESFESNEIYEYIAGGLSCSNHDPNTASIPIPVKVDNSSTNGSGYSISDVERFLLTYEEILKNPNSSIELFEAMVDDINNTISSKLWKLLRDQHRFMNCLQAMRNTYLLGKGELHQAFLDGILGLMHSHGAVPDSRNADAFLNWDVVRNAGKLLNIDDDELSNVLRLRINSPHVKITTFNVKSKELIYVGSARPSNLTPKSYSTSSRTQDHLNLCSFDDIDESHIGRHIWEEYCSAWPDHQFHSVDPKQPGDEKLRYTRGGVWLADSKYIAKGFSMTTSFECNWTSVLDIVIPYFRRGLTKAHSIRSTVSSITTPPLLIGSLTHVYVNGNMQSANKLGSDDLGIEIPGSLCIGVSFHAKSIIDFTSMSSASTTVTSIDHTSVEYYARLFICGSRDQSRMSRLTHDDSEGQFLYGDDMSVLAEKVIPLRPWGQSAGDGNALLSANAPFVFEVEYTRDVRKDVKEGIRGDSINNTSFSVRIRLRQDNSEKQGVETKDLVWDLAFPLDLSHFIKNVSGTSNIGIVGSGVIYPRNVINTPPISNISLSTSSPLNRHFGINITSITFKGKGALATYPVTSTYTSTRFPDTFLRLESELSSLRSWLNLQLEFEIPSIFRILFDSDAISCYERIFSLLIKVRLVDHALERLWMGSSRLEEDRTFCQVRHSMHFFISNLLYYLQVDVIDSEFMELQSQLSRCDNFQGVLRHHRSFIASIVRLSMVDNSTVQEAIDRVLHVSLRFIAVCRILHLQEEKVDNKIRVPGFVIIPPEEISSIRKDFFTQITFLFTILRQVETRGFLFRIDFNGYFSSMAGHFD